jgi:hypothetical protein
VPFADGERMTYVIREDWGSTTARGVLTVRRDGDRLRLEQRYEEAQPPAGAQPNVDASTVLVAAADLRPVAMERTITGHDTSHAYTAKYAADAKSVEVQLTAEAKNRCRAGDAYYDNESALWIWRTPPSRLPRPLRLDRRDRTHAPNRRPGHRHANSRVPAGTFRRGGCSA